MSDQRMIDTQARHITRLNGELTKAAMANTRLERRVEEMTPAYEYYMAIQKTVLADESCMEAWQAFLVMVALTSDPIPGLTTQPVEDHQYSLSFGA